MEANDSIEKGDVSEELVVLDEGRVPDQPIHPFFTPKATKSVIVLPESAQLHSQAVAMVSEPNSNASDLVLSTKAVPRAGSRKRSLSDESASQIETKRARVGPEPTRVTPAQRVKEFPDEHFIVDLGTCIFFLSASWAYCAAY